jgi:hypothetical protein
MPGPARARQIVPQIEIDSIMPRGLLAPELTRGEAHRVHVLRLLAEEMGVGIREDKDAVTRGTAVLIAVRDQLVALDQDRIRGRMCRRVILTPRTSLLRMWQAEELFRRGAPTSS